MGIFHSFSFLLWFIYVYSLILAPNLIQVIYAIYAHTRTHWLENNRMEMIVVHGAAIETWGKLVIYVS